jgi:hypothetical protein
LRIERRRRNYQNPNDQQPVQMARSHEQALLRRVSFSGRRGIFGKSHQFGEYGYVIGAHK